jgi:hypothetical protein
MGGKRKLVDLDRTDLWTLLDGEMKKVINCIKKVCDIPLPSDIPAVDGNAANLFYSVKTKIYFSYLLLLLKTPHTADKLPVLHKSPRSLQPEHNFCPGIKQFWIKRNKRFEILPLRKK